MRLGCICRGILIIAAFQHHPMLTVGWAVMLGVAGRRGSLQLICRPPYGVIEMKTS